MNALNYAPLLIAVIAFPLLLHSVKRGKEVDERGYPALRLFGPALLLVFLGLLALFDSFGLVHILRLPEFVDFAFAGATFVGAAWFFYSKATLTESSIQISMWPMSRSYSLDKFLSVDIFGKDARKGSFGAVVRFSDGRKFGVLPFASGQKHFLEELEKRVGQRANA
jgi:hypothetical protein